MKKLFILLFLGISLFAQDHNLSINEDINLTLKQKVIGFDCRSQYLMAIWVNELKTNDYTIGDFFAFPAVTDGESVFGGNRVYDSYKGSVSYYKKTNGKYPLTQFLTPQRNYYNEQFGVGMVVEGDTLFVGATYYYNNLFSFEGVVYVYTKDENGLWVYTQQLSSPNESMPGFGTHVAKDGDVFLTDNYKIPAVYVYRNIDGKWTPTQEIKLNDALSSSFIYKPLAVEGDIAVIGTDSGAYVYKDENGTFIEVQKLLLDNNNSVNSVSIDNGDIFLSTTDGESATYIFRKDENGTYSKYQKFDIGGIDISTNGDIAVVGNYLNQVIYLLQKKEGNWTLIQTIEKPDISHFGTTVSYKNGILATDGYVTEDTYKTFLFIYKVSRLYKVNEGQAYIGDINITSADENDTIVYTLEGDDANLFTITPDGNLSFKQAPDYENPLDINKNNVYNVTVVADNSYDKVSLPVSVTVENTGSGDDDGDGLEDAWEYKYFGTISYDGDGDFDSDGVSNADEFALGTNPAETDSDGDALSDKYEIDNALAPAFNQFSQPVIATGLQFENTQKFSSVDYTTSKDSFGYDVAVDNDYAVIGTKNNPSVAYVYKKEDGVWRLDTKLFGEEDSYGKTVAINGDIIAIGAESKNEGRGSVFVYKNSGGSWGEMQRLTAEDADVNDYFGHSISVDGNYILVGAYNKNSSAGKAYLFENSDGLWSLKAEFEPADLQSGERFGISVYVNNDIIAIGADGDNNETGSVYIYTLKNGEWIQSQKLTADDASDGFKFGHRVSGDGGVIAVEGSGNRCVYLYKRDLNGTWSENNKFCGVDQFALKGNILVTSDTHNNGGTLSFYSKNTQNGWDKMGDYTVDYGYVTTIPNATLGYSLSTNGEDIFAGAPFADDSEAYGSVYVFDTYYKIDTKENIPFVKSINAMDDDNSTMEYSLNGDDADKFRITDDGSLSFKTAPDYENPEDKNHDNEYVFYIKAKSAHNLSSEIAVRVDVTDNDDEDEDNLSDRWEREYFGNLDQNASGDYDGDTISNGEEYTLGTNPALTDSDGDGLSDEDEINIYHTNPIDPDTDGDGASDGEEVKNSTNPLVENIAPRFYESMQFLNDNFSLYGYLLTNKYERASGAGWSAVNGDGWAIFTHPEYNEPPDPSDVRYYGMDADFVDLNDISKISEIIQPEDINKFGIGAAMSGKYALTAGSVARDVLSDIKDSYGEYNVYIIQLGDDGIWHIVQTLTKKTFEDDKIITNNCYFGQTKASFDIDKDWIIVGDELYDHRHGRVYFYHKEDNGTWVQTQEITPDEEMQRYMWFGVAASINGSYAAALAADGRTYIFKKDSNNIWNVKQKIDPDDESTELGYAVLKDDYLVLTYRHSTVDYNVTYETLIYKRDDNGTYNKIQKIHMPIEYNRFNSSINEEPVINLDNQLMMISGMDDNDTKFFYTLDANGTWSFLGSKSTSEDPYVVDHGGESVNKFGSSAMKNGLVVYHFVSEANLTYYSKFLIGHVMEAVNYVKKVGKLNVNDPDGNKITYSLAGKDASLFTIDDNATIYFKNLPTEYGKMYLFRVTATDEYNATNIMQIQVNLSFNDSDGDSMDDDWERMYFGNLDRDGSGDTDGDGLSDAQEFANHTDPTKVDTDSDGLSDGEEVNDYHSNPLSTDGDGDGIGDWDEVKVYSTNPISIDTDSDGINDYEEINVYHTSPLNPDSDADGIGDGVESHFPTDINSKDSYIKFNGDAIQINGYVMLTPDEANKSASVFMVPFTEFNDTTDFNAGFKARIYHSADTPYDGFAYVLQNDDRNESALGALGGYIGYSDINNSIAVAFKTGDVNQIQILKDGNLTPLDSAALPDYVKSNQDFYVWVDYSSRLHRLNVYISDTDSKPSTTVISYEINLSEIIGNRVFTGFSAGTGAGSEENDIYYYSINWSEDSDGDGLSDYEEINVYHTDPNKTDTDGDGLSDYEEVVTYHTDPNKTDSDGDGLSDYEEVITYHSDPLSTDGDGDGISDWDEVKIYHSNALSTDSDGDGFLDSFERLFGTDMANAASYLHFNGDESYTQDSLELINNTGSVYNALAHEINESTGFKAHFAAKMYHLSLISTEDKYDYLFKSGIAFVIQNDERNETALGDEGRGMGYGGVNNSIAVAIKTGDARELQILKNGDMNPVASVPLPVYTLQSRNFYVWVDYMAGINKLNVYISDTDTKPEEPLLSCDINLSETVGERAFVGFSGSSYYEKDYIYSFEINWSEDSDGDGLSDNEEINVYHTDPAKVDTDGDGLSDYEEVMTYHTDPAKVDTDGDGLSDYEEVMTYHTDPNKADSDGDGLSDYEEVMTYHTDPTKADTDADGINDGDEINVYDTNATNSDTDGDGINDKTEVDFGASAVDADSVITFNGDALISGGYITLTSNEANQTGSIYIVPAKEFNNTTCLFSAFKMEFNSSNGEGAAFVIQSDSKNALGEELGYEGVDRSIAVAFKTDANEIEILKDGNMTPLATAQLPEYVKDSQPFYVWVDYRSGIGELEVYISDEDIKPDNPLMTYSVDLADVTGGAAYVGFSARSGDDAEGHYVYYLDMDMPADSDGDGLSDNEEISVYHTDPANADSDGDGLNDGLEVFVYNSNPNVSDTDEDGLNDGDEVHVYHTDPANYDSDGDGISDGDEVHVYHTDPANADSDADGANDNVELLFGTDVNDSSSYVKLNGDATQSADHIALTVETNDQTGSAYIVPAQTLDEYTGINAHFKIKIAHESSSFADGMAFVIQNSENNESALGGSGGDMGYSGITNSIAVAFKTYTTNQIQILKDGNMTPLATADLPDYALNNGYFYVWVDYLSNRLNVYISDTDSKPSDAVLSYDINLSEIVGERAFIGFSGATGGLAEENDVYFLEANWTTDSDGDGLSDYDENEVYDTNASNPDTDGDGLSDYDEVKVYDTNATNTDTDADGLSDYEEVMTYHTDPTKADSDADGLNDYEEVKVYDTNATNVDTDGDGLNDYDEIKVYDTNVSNSDSDADGINDLLEVRLNTNPNSSESLIHTNGDANISKDHIILTSDEVNKTGSAYILPAYDLSSVNGFSAYFKAKIGHGAYELADGMAFVIQSDDRNETALGGGGGSIGYSEVANSVAVAFKTYYTNQIQILKNGSMTPLATADLPDYVTNNEDFYVWVDYRGKLNRLEVYVSDTPQKPYTPQLAYDDINISEIVGNSAYMGFSAATGEVTEENDIYAFEINWSTDTDGDGLTDSEETNMYDTNMSNPDSDGDGLTDYEEVMNYHTDPNVIDSDGDGLSDYAEVKTYGTNPTKADSDGDGISDSQELANGTDPLVAPLAISPSTYLFNSSGSVEFTITNIGDTNVTVPKAVIEDGSKEAFGILEDNCEGVTLAPGESCKITVQTPGDNPNEFIYASLNVSNVKAFMYNYESLDSEASRRLPPVIDTLDIPDVMQAGEEYNLTFSVLGYDDDYTLYMAFFNCDGVPEGECGNSYNDPERFAEALDLHPYRVAPSAWVYNGKTANEFSYTYTFTPPADLFKEGNTTIVIRFYYKTKKAEEAGDPSISLIVPGNLSQKYYDTSGRRIEKTISK